MNIRMLMLVSILMASVQAHADWHAGKVTSLGHAYDGQTITFQLSGWTRNNCTCYAPWNNSMCLDRSRLSFPQDYAWLLRARTSGQIVQANIDEATCKIVALFETD